MNDRDHAANLLTYYMRTSWEAAGLTWNGDNDSEAGAIVDSIIGACTARMQGQAVERRYVECGGGKYREHVVTIVPGQDGSATVYERTAQGNGGPVFDGPANLADRYARDRDQDLTGRGYTRVADVRN